MMSRLFLTLLCVAALSSCSTLFINNADQNTQSSSLVEFLFPKSRAGSEKKPEIPVLNLPVNVGLAFVPSENWRRSGIQSKDQIELLEGVRQSFLKYDYIDRIEVIPSIYLESGKGFPVLERVGRLYDIDVMALVSYDQVAQTSKNNAALFYWTIVGMYVIPGNENSVQTFVDTAVFDIKSKKMLFRAPGVNKLEKRTTAVGVESAMADKSLEGFYLAVADMTTNLDAELARFKTRVKEEEVAKIEHREGYTGSGSASLYLLIAALVVLLGRVADRKFRSSYSLSM